MAFGVGVRGCVSAVFGINHVFDRPVGVRGEEELFEMYKEPLEVVGLLEEVNAAFSSVKVGAGSTLPSPSKSRSTVPNCVYCK